jgi:hypothetical protein
MGWRPILLVPVVCGLAFGIGKGIRVAFLSPASGKSAALAAQGTASGNDAGYRVGDRLQAAAPKPNGTPAAPAPYQDVEWFALVPKGWDPTKEFNANMGKWKDSDPRAMQALQELREAWDNAPTEPSMDGARIRIPGFAVPLESEHGQVTEFLLVPYFGACIHTPPPPANQIIHAFADKPLKGLRTMDAVWVSGVLKVARSRTADNTMGLVGSVGYQMKAEIVTPYKAQ